MSPFNVRGLLLWPSHVDGVTVSKYFYFFCWTTGGGCLRWNSTGNRKTYQMFIFSLLMGPLSSHGVTRHFYWRTLSPPPVQQTQEISALQPHRHSRHFKTLWFRRFQWETRVNPFHFSFSQKHHFCTQCPNLKISGFRFDVILYCFTHPSVFLMISSIAVYK